MTSAVRLPLATLALLAGTSAASAYCPTLPESAASHYVANGAAHALCLERELAAETARRNELAALNAAVAALQAQQLQQRFPAPPAFLPSPYAAAWP